MSVLCFYGSDQKQKYILHLQHMKLLSFILLSVIALPVFQSAHVLFEDFQNAQEVCCSTTCGDDSSNEKPAGDCSGKLCNPFHACGACVLLFTPNRHVVENPAQPFKKSSFSLWVKFYKNLCVFDFWHPPQIN